MLLIFLRRRIMGLCFRERYLIPASVRAGRLSLMGVMIT